MHPPHERRERHLLAPLPCAIPLCAWGLRALPRLGTVLGALTLAASVWLYVDVRWGAGALAVNRPDAPFGPLVHAFPVFAKGSVWPYALAGAVGAGLVALVLVELRRFPGSRPRPPRSLRRA